MRTFTKLLISFLILITFLICISCKKGGKDLFEKSLKTKDTTEKRILREEIAEKYPDTEYGYFSKAGIVYMRGHKEEAVRLYTKAIEINPNFVQAYYNRGIAYNDIREYFKAISDFTKAIEINPDYAEAYYNRGVAYIDMINYSQAISDFTKAIELNPNDADAYVWRGFAFDKKGNNYQACIDWKKAYQLGNKNVIELINKFCK